MFSLGVGTPAFTADLTTEQKRGFAAVALTIAYCMLDQNLVSRQQSAAMAVDVADTQGVSKDELISFSKEPGFADLMSKVKTTSGGCKTIAEQFKAALSLTR